MAQAIKKTRQVGGERGTNRRDAMLDSACQLFYDKGYASASMRDISNVIGVTQAALYYHFPNKEEMLFALIEEFSEKLVDVIEAAVASVDDPVAALLATVRAHILLGRSHHREFKFVTEDSRHLSEAHGEALRLHQRKVFSVYRDLIASILREQRVKGRDPSVAAFNTLAMINYVFNWYRSEGPKSLEEIADETAAFVVTGLIGK